MQTKRNTMLAVAAVLILAIGVGVVRNMNKLGTPEMPFTEAQLDALGTQIENLEFDDLEGLPPDASTPFSFTAEDLDQLEAAINGLEFEDLEGLTTP